MTRGNGDLSPWPPWPSSAAACGDDDDASDHRHHRRGRRAREAPPAPKTRPHEGTAAEATGRTEGPTLPRTTEAEGRTAAVSVDPAEHRDSTSASTTTTIKVGMLADLSGAFAPLVQEIVAAQQVYWDNVNANGRHRRPSGRAGHRGQRLRRCRQRREVRDRPRRGRHHQPGHRLAAHRGDRRGPVDDNLVAIPLSWYSGWADPEHRPERVRELHQLLHRVDERARVDEPEPRGRRPSPSSPSPVSTAATAPPAPRWRPRHLGLEVVYDGDGQVTPPSADNPNPDQSAVVVRRSSTPTPTWCGRRSTRRRSARSWASAVGQGLHGAVVGQLADLQLQAARHRAGAAARRVLHRLDVHRHVGHRRARHAGRRRHDDRGPARPARSPTSTSSAGPRR